MGPNTCGRQVSNPLLQHCKVFNRVHEQKNGLSLNGGFLDEVFTYVYSPPTNLLCRFWETCTPRFGVWLVVNAERSPRGTDRDRVGWGNRGAMTTTYAQIFGGSSRLRDGDSR